jgi:predicted XRE-type DNA-binding protein
MPNTNDTSKPASVNKQLLKEAKELVKKLKDTKLKQDFIAAKMDVSSSSLSRFMNYKNPKNHAYLNKSMIATGNKFLQDLADGKIMSK